MCLAFRVVVHHILLAGKLGLRDERVALTASVFIGRPGFEREDVWFAVLISVPKELAGA
jgi:hypothetical protein